MAEPSHPENTMSIDITRRTNRSVYMFVLQHVVKLFSAQLIKPKKTFPGGSPRLKPHSKATRLCDVTEREVEGIYVYDLSVKPHVKEQRDPPEGSKDEKKRRKRLYYFAGGGWQVPASSEHWALCAHIASQIPDTTVSVVSYPLAPNSPAPIAFPEMMKLYRQVLRDAEEADEEVILAGDSAGGNVILCMTLTGLLEDESAPCPKGIMAISPSTDLRRHNPEIKLLEKHDPILNIRFINWTAKTWRGEWEADDPRVSPLTADISPLVRRKVKVHGIVGRYDILSPDAVLFREKCNQAGVRGEWLDWEKQMHVFPLMFAFKLPEAVAATHWMVDVLRRT